MVSLSCLLFNRSGGAPRAFRRLQSLRINARFQGRGRNCFRIGIRLQMKALQYARLGRKQKRIDFKELWNTRLEAASEEHGIPFRYVWDALKGMNVALNRKVLTDLSIHEPRTFAGFCEMSKQYHLDKGLNLPPHSKPQIPVVTRGML